jgi:PAS domain-containing protein
MSPESLMTAFASPSRSSRSDLEAQFRIFEKMDGLNQIVALIPEVILILNENRQIVFANKVAISLFESNRLESVIGLRPGELLDCVHASETPGGCGTTKFCANCGAVKAILSGLKGIETVDECKIIQKKSGDAFDLRVWTFPLRYDDQPFTLFVINDISNEKRRRILERIFFHDVLNTASGIHSFSEILKEANQDELEEFQGIIYRLSNRLIDEITAQRELLAAESNELKSKPVATNSLEIINDVCDLYRNNELAKGKKLVVFSGSQSIDMTADQGLLTRVLTNMTKNALEASAPGDIVTLGCELVKGQVEFWVHNPVFIPENIQLQIFQRSFSTKGTARGLGTYSMKLLSERYLKGSVSFTSTEKEGTKFMARYPIS